MKLLSSWLHSWYTRHIMRNHKSSWLQARRSLAGNRPKGWPVPMNRPGQELEANAMTHSQTEGFIG